MQSNYEIMSFHTKLNYFSMLTLNISICSSIKVLDDKIPEKCEYSICYFPLQNRKAKDDYGETKWSVS
jgi:uncharacterized protein YutD